MACPQLIGLRDRVEDHEKDPASPADPETGDRAGVAGKEEGVKWRQSAIRDGVLREVE